MLCRAVLAGWHAEPDRARHIRKVAVEEQFCEAVAVYQLEATRPVLQACLAQDKVDFVAEAQLQVAAATTQNNAQAMFDGLRKLQRFHPRDPPYCRTRTGRSSPSFIWPLHAGLSSLEAYTKAPPLKARRSSR